MRMEETKTGINGKRNDEGNEKGSKEKGVMDLK